MAERIYTDRIYGTIEAIANERVVTADDFVTFVGLSNWLVIDAEDLPREDRNADNFAEDAVCKFTIRRVFVEAGKVEVIYFTRSHPEGIAMHLDADELAIRIEAS